MSWQNAVQSIIHTAGVYILKYVNPSHLKEKGKCSHKKQQFRKLTNITLYFPFLSEIHVQLKHLFIRYTFKNWEDLKIFQCDGAGGRSVLVREKQEGAIHDRWTHMAASKNWFPLTDKHCPPGEECKVSIDSSTSGAPAMVLVTNISYTSTS